MKNTKQYLLYLTETIYDAIRVEKCVEARNIPGGPSKEYTEKLIKLNDEYIKNLEK